MPTFGITPTGFLIKPQSQILADMQAIELAQISTNLDLQPPDPIAVVTGIFSQMIAELWQLGGALYGGMDPDVAGDDQLTGLSLITGTGRLAPQPTQVLGCTVNVNAGFSAAPGTMFASPIGNPAALFKNKESVSNPGGSPANETVDFVAVDTGPTQVLASTLTVISQPVTGWNSVTNPTAGVTGTNIESDPDLRLRREEELQALGSTTAPAIRSDVLLKMVPPATTSETLACTVLHNDGDVVDANNLPPHSIEVIAYQPGNTSDDDKALVDLILADKAAGIGTYGLEQATATDSQGNQELISFTRPVSVSIYVAVTVKVDPLKFPAGALGPATVRSVLTAYANGEWQPGISVYLKGLQSSLFPSPNDILAGIAGILDITDFKIGETYPATGTSNISIDVRHIARISTIDVTVT